MRETDRDLSNENNATNASRRRAKSTAPKRLVVSRRVLSRALRLVSLGSLGVFGSCQLDTDPWPGLPPLATRSDADTARFDAGAPPPDAGAPDSATSAPVDAGTALTTDAATPIPITHDAMPAPRAEAGRAGEGHRRANAGTAAPPPSAASDADGGSDDRDAGEPGF
jgi:hypothetical protein